MSVTNPDGTDVETDLLCAAADAATAVLATDSRLAGPAAAQDTIEDLVVAEEIRGIWADLADGTQVIVFATPAVLSDAAQGPAGDGLVVELGPVIAAAAAALGLPEPSPRPVVSMADLPVAVTEPTEAMIIAGAGVFDGDDPVASVGVIRSASVSAALRSGGSAAPSAPSAAPVASSGGGGGSVGGPKNFHLLADVELGVSAELGRTTMSMGELLDLQPGGVIELRRTVGTPIDVMVNGTLIARGEVVVVDDAYAVRVTEVVSEKDS